MTDPGKQGLDGEPEAEKGCDLLKVTPSEAEAGLS